MKNALFLAFVFCGFVFGTNPALAENLDDIRFEQATQTDAFNGTWSGKGVYRRDGLTTNCQMNVEFFGESSTFRFVSGDRACERHSEVFDPVLMHVVDGLLVWNGMEVGTFANNFVTVDIRVPEGNGRIRHYRMSMRMEGSVLTYEESRRMDGDAEPLITFAGVLVRQ